MSKTDVVLGLCPHCKGEVYAGYGHPCPAGGPVEYDVRDLEPINTYAVCDQREWMNHVLEAIEEGTYRAIKEIGCDCECHT